MVQLGKRTKTCSRVARIVFVILFTGGFVYQTFQFLMLYWTYPTVVDIQQNSPSFVEVPAFTFCNRIGYKFDNICNFTKATQTCLNSLFTSAGSPIVCGSYPATCINGTALPEEFKVMFFGKLMEKHSITREEFSKLAVPLEEYLDCTIEYAGKTTPCNLENVLGSFYTKDDLPQFCYSIYSLWGQPEKKREVIPKGSTMKFKLFLNISGRGPDEEGNYLPPLHNTPCDPSVQIAVHSPYFLPSPYLTGNSYLGGRAYELRIKLSESHLLPLPYQTNCTDYMTSWHARNGKAPINQLSIIQECRINKTYEALGCIPVDMDYPHSYNICKSCPVIKLEECTSVEAPNNCSLLADSYNQPCDSMTYIVDREDKAISVFKTVKSRFAHPSDGIRLVMPMHDCENEKMWRPECSTIEIDVPFDQFEITNIIYNPKFESLELFSVIGGYMGMWLGISLITVYDVMFNIFVYVRSYTIKRRKTKTKSMKAKAVGQNGSVLKDRRNDRLRSYYGVW